MGVDMADPNAADDIPASELHLPKGKRIIFKFRSQDVLHSAYMPHFRAQMNVVPGMVTEFSFIPTVTTAEMREDKKIMDKVAHINELRSQKSAELAATGGTALEPYTFDYLLLCNKICGPSHYNMQMKIVVDEKADFDKWIAGQKTLGTAVKESQEKPATDAPAAPKDSTAKNADTVAVMPQDTTKTVAQAKPAAH
jgi:cytochrome c oxidase subunit 2